MTTEATLGAIDAFWADQLGCLPPALRAPGLAVLGPAQTHGGSSVFVCWRDPACVVTVVAGLLDRVEPAVRAAAAADLVRPAFWQALLGVTHEAIRGPAWLGYADASDFRPCDQRGSRLLDTADTPALRRLAERCAPLEWEHGGIEFGQWPVFGCRRGDELVAAGTLKDWSELLRHVGIVTDPARRGQGYGKAVVSAMTERALAEGGIAQYRTLESNLPSIGIARSLGYEPYATTLAIRVAAGAG